MTQPIENPTEQQINDYIYNKYKHLLPYANKIIYNFSQKNKTKARFKQMSLDYDDIKQEVHVELFKIFREYDEKYKDETKVHLKLHVRDICTYIMLNLLRNNRNKVFVPLDNDIKDEDVENMNKQITKVEEDEPFDKVLIHPDVIPTTIHRESLSNEEITKILKSCDLSEIDYKVLEMKIVYKNTLEEIKVALGLKSRQAVQVAGCVLRREWCGECDPYTLEPTWREQLRMGQRMGSVAEHRLDDGIGIWMIEAANAESG